MSGAEPSARPVRALAKAHRRVTATIRILLPVDQSPMEGLSRAYPYLRFTVLGIQTTRNQLILDIRIPFGTRTEEVIRFLLRHPRTVQLDVLLARTYGGVVRVVTTLPVPSFYPLLVRSGLVPLMPFQFSNGIVYVTSVAPHSRVVKTFRSIRDGFPGTTLGPVREGVVLGVEGQLTPRQYEVFRLGLAHGYWDVPRRISLTTLANLVDTSKSTLSEILAGVEQKVLNEMAERALGSEGGDT